MILAPTSVTIVIMFIEIATVPKTEKYRNEMEKACLYI